MSIRTDLSFPRPFSFGCEAYGFQRAIAIPFPVDIVAPIPWWRRGRSIVDVRVGHIERIARCLRGRSVQIELEIFRRGLTSGQRERPLYFNCCHGIAGKPQRIVRHTLCAVDRQWWQHSEKQEHAAVN